MLIMYVEVLNYIYVKNNESKFDNNSKIFFMKLKFKISHFYVINLNVIMKIIKIAIFDNYIQDPKTRPKTDKKEGILTRTQI